jgi:iron complex outermembrane receptor protein
MGASSLVALALLGAGAPAYAATAAAAAADEATATNAPVGLTEVVVTARRREENVQRVPSTVQVLTKQALLQRGIHTEADLQLNVPGLVVRSFDTSNYMSFAIRGESLDSYSGSAPGVQPYINEIPVSAYTPSAIFDMQNVQVLKGPQGTLFGRNSTGGAVLYTTTMPGNVFGGYASLQYGNLDKLIAEAAVDLPILPDKVQLRLAGTFADGGNYVHNLYDGKELGEHDGGAYRATLVLKPTDKLTNTTTFQYVNQYGRSTPAQVSYTAPCGYAFNNNACLYVPSNPTFQAFIQPGQTLFPYEPYPIGKTFNFPAGPGYPAGTAVNGVFPYGFYLYNAFIHNQRPYTVDDPGNFAFHSIADFLGNTTTYQVTPDFELKNSFGYQLASLHSSTNNSLSSYYIQNTGGNPPGGPNVERPIITIFSDEFQAQGKAFDNKLTYIVGFFFNDEKDDFNSPINGIAIFGDGPPVLGGTYVPFSVRYHLVEEDRSLAGFAQATYAVTDKLNFTGGVRYTDDLITAFQGQDVFNPDGTNPQHQSDHETNPSWTVTVDYHVSPEWMLYVTNRGSFRVGGYSVAQAPGPGGSNLSAGEGGNHFLPETIVDVEAGSKFNGNLGGVPVRFNVDIFNAWVTNVQKSLDTLVNNTISSVTLNVPKSNVFGIETDFEFRLTDWLSVGGNAAYTDAEFVSKQATIDLFGTPTQAYLGHFADAPKYAGALFADFTIPLAPNYGTLKYHVDVYYQSGLYTSSVSDIYTPYSELPEYALVNMRLDWHEPFGKKGLTASMFVKNLGDKLYYAGGSAGAPDIGAESVNYGQPRTFGGILRYEW